MLNFLSRMFESLPEFSSILKAKQAESEEAAPEKWKMKFAKDDTKQRKNQFGFAYESDDEDQARNIQAAAPAPTSYGMPGTSSQYEKVNKQKSPPPKPKLEFPQHHIPLVSKGPVVLDKFGNFRLADPVQALPPKPLEPTSSTRRSRSPRRRTRSRSHSRSPRRRRSGSYRSRRYSRSYSRYICNDDLYNQRVTNHFIIPGHILEAAHVHEGAGLSGEEVDSTQDLASVRSESGDHRVVAAGLTITGIFEEVVDRTLIETDLRDAVEDLAEDVSIAAILEVSKEMNQATDETIVGTRTVRVVGPKKTVSGSQT